MAFRSSRWSSRWFLALLALVLPASVTCRASDLREDARTRPTASASVAFRHFV